MALTPEIRAPQAGIIAAIRQSAREEIVPQAQVIAAYNIPAERVQVTFGGENVVYRQDSQELRSTQGQVMAVVRGRIDNPKLRAWTYTLDSHDYYILKLGTTGKTLVLDLTTETWSWWTNGGLGNWRASIGMNWRSAGMIPTNYGTNVIVGDDSYGVLWVLDPLQGVDDALLSDEQVTFERVATGQMVTRDRNFLPVYSVDLTASLGGPALEVNSVKLEYSDDQGHTYVTADEPQVSVFGNYDQEFSWRSLGLVRAPGRLFRITDNGAFARIDSLNVNE
jgi:hypothetical protein